MVVKRTQDGNDGTHLFVLRVWVEELDGQSEYRGRVEHVLSGELSHFRDWDTLQRFLIARVDGKEQDAGD